MSVETTRKRRTIAVPITTMEELPELSEEERAELLVSLKQAETDIEAGNFVKYDSKSFKEQLLRIYRAKNQ